MSLSAPQTVAQRAAPPQSGVGSEVTKIYSPIHSVHCGFCEMDSFRSLITGD